MKSRFLSLVVLLFLCSFVVLSPKSEAGQDPAIIGKTEEEVSKLLGKPIGKMEIGGDLILTFARTTVTFRDGKAIETEGYTPPPPDTRPKASAAENADSDTYSGNVAEGTVVDIKFTAVDGTEVDLSQMRGKVVLVDFWATWCGPCVGEVPHVVEAYKKYHDQGFEIVGISLDSDQKRLTDFISQKEMTWPQYFDGKGWKNKISSGYGIQAIPAMWLIDRDGKLVTKNARSGLTEQITKLLGK
jgi:thiol-disulfide isomerase/thioredoxin